MTQIERFPLYMGRKSYPEQLNLPTAQPDIKKALEDLIEFGSQEDKQVREFLNRSYKGEWPLQTVATESLVFIQEWFITDRLLNYAEVKHFPRNEPIMVARWKNQHLIMDGNHRSAVAYKQKQPNVCAAVLDVNKILGNYFNRMPV